MKLRWNGHEICCSYIKLAILRIMKGAIGLCFMFVIGLLSVDAQSARMDMPADSLFTFKDSRDSREYTAFRLNGIDWMGENLRFKTKDSYCYDAQGMGCKDFGRLYTWDDAVTACPAGWRLPTNVEWDSLIAWTGGEKKAGYVLAYGDSLGFKIQFGFPPNINGRYSGNNIQASYWSADAYNASTAWVYYFLKDKLPLTYTNYFSKNYGMSCRCVRVAADESAAEDKK
mgnify:CR=1 FL=1